MTETIRRPRLGDAWTTDWAESLDERVREHGFSSMTEFVESRPSATLLELANELGQTAPVQIEWRWIAEAAASGRVERCARSLLVRRLRWKLPEGWQREWVDVPGDLKTPRFRKISAYSSFAVALPEQYKQAADRVLHALDSAEIPEGWLPASGDDPVIVDLFQRHWPEPP